MSNYTRKTALAKLRNANRHLERIHLPKLVDLNEASPFDVVLVKCRCCQSAADKYITTSGWMIECESISCENEIQSPVYDEWQASLLWNQLNAAVLDFKNIPFFNLNGLSRSEARRKMQHIDNYVRMNKDKIIATEYLGIDTSQEQQLFSVEYWKALYCWVLTTKASVSQFKATSE